MANSQTLAPSLGALSPAARRALGYTLGLARTSTGKRGVSFDALPVGQKTRILNLWGAAQVSPVAHNEAALVRHQVAIERAADAMPADRPAIWGDEVQARLTVLSKALDAIGTLAGTATTQRLQTAGPLSAAIDFEHTVPYGEFQIDHLRHTLEIPLLNEHGAPVLGRGRVDVPRVGLGERVDTRPINYYQIASESFWLQAGAIPNEQNILDTTCMNALRRALQDAVYLGDMDLAWDSVFDQGVLNQSGGSLTGTGAITVKTATDACINVLHKARQAGRGEVVPNRVMLGDRLAQFLEGTYESGTDSSGMDKLKRSLANYGLGEAAIKVSTGLDTVADGVGTTRFLVTAADGSESGFGVRLLAPPEPLMIAYSDQGSQVMHYAWPCAGVHTRSRASIASAAFTFDDSVSG